MFEIVSQQIPLPAIGHSVRFCFKFHLVSAKNFDKRIYSKSAHILQKQKIIYFTLCESLSLRLQCDIRR